ncbi:MAG: ATP-binding protein [Phycisphaerae bacterium]|nr:ATP-binding protein [Phycisphaerae bacterium]
MSAAAAIGIGAVLGLALAVPVALALCKRAEARARGSERRARESEHLAYVGTLTGGLAHEIRNPLSTLTLNLELLREDLERPGNHTDARVLRKLDTLQQETRRLEQILDDFLRFAGQHEVHLEAGDLNAILKEAVAFYQERLERAGIQVRTSFADPGAPGPAVALDADLLKQAVSNLVLNAEAAMPRGGELMISTERAKGGVRIHVTDTGVGIRPEDLDKIGRPYYSTRQGGTGLGLPTVHRIVREHEGRLEIQSEPGRGTRFTIWLPAAGKTRGTPTDG